VSVYGQMENIIFGVISLLSRLTTFWNNLFGSFKVNIAGQFVRVAKLSEAAVALMLWSVPVAFWTVVIRFVVKHW